MLKADPQPNKFFGRGKPSYKKENNIKINHHYEYLKFHFYQSITQNILNSNIIIELS